MKDDGKLTIYDTSALVREILNRNISGETRKILEMMIKGDEREGGVNLEPLCKLVKFEMPKCYGMFNCITAVPIDNKDWDEADKIEGVMTLIVGKEKRTFRGILSLSGIVKVF